jgi:hypothetical protein
MRGLSATLEVADEDSDDLALILQLSNGTDAIVDLPNPDVGRPPPDADWPWSEDAYRASLLISFGLLELEVTDATGDPVRSDIPQTWATPVLRPRLELTPGDRLDVLLPIGLFFELEPGRNYQVIARYGDVPEKAQATITFSVPT